MKGVVKCFWVGAWATLSLGVAACVDMAEEPTAGQEDRAFPTWEAFRDSSTRHFGLRTSYVIDGDIAVSLDELHAEYGRLFGQVAGPGVAIQASTVNRAFSQDDVWNRTIAQDLTFCISSDFGARKSRVVSEMQQAAADWQQRARVGYRYVPSEDGNCTGSNQKVTFAVRPWTSSGACSFFPSGGGCVARTLVINYDDLDSGAYGAVTTVGVLRHELGHTLGLRHEHIRAPGTTCTEDSSWRAVTTYDSASVMHYPWCPGATNVGDLLITEQDSMGIRNLYPRSWPHSADVDGDGRDDLVLQYDLNLTREWQARVSTGTSFTYNGDWTSTGTPDVLAIGMADVNGDGRADVVLQYDINGTRYWQARVSTGNSFTYNGDWTSTGTPGVVPVGLADVNGDGRADLVLQYDIGGTRFWQARLSTGTSFTYNGDWTSTGTPGVEAIGVADVNGDGRADLVLQYDIGGTRFWQARVSTGTSFTYNGDWTSTGTPGVVPVGMADVNGDGRADLVLQYDIGATRFWQARASTGTSFTYNGDWTSTGTPGVVPVGMADVDGDGRADLVLQYDIGTTRYWQSRLSLGTSFTYNGDWTSTDTPNVEPVR